jgi:5-bromo-4-chloroindolyl phosphate hydrolysis protein
MERTASTESQERAARNQSLFRAVNEKLNDVNEMLSSVSDTFVIACECADTNCVEMIDISPQDYADVRADPRRFVILAGHVYPDVENVIRQVDGYVVVEKFAVAGEIAEAAASSDGGGS